MPQPANNDLRLAVLIDADNVPAKAINVMMVEIANYGKPTYKRISSFGRVFASRPCALKFRPVLGSSKCRGSVLNASPSSAA